MLRKKIGEHGEKLAQTYLCQRGYRIIAANYHCHYGEIDIIAQDGDVLVFVEVRSKSNIQYGRPEETVDLKKQNKLKKTAQYYLCQQKQMERYCRFDVVAIIWDTNLSAEIHLMQDAFY